MRFVISKTRLRLFLGLFFLAIVAPTSMLVLESFEQMKWEAFTRHQALAVELSQRIDQRVDQLIAKEEARTFAEYSFLNVAGDAANNFLQRSPLSTFPVESDLPGLMGYFQVDDQGRFSSPLLPLSSSRDRFGISAEEYVQRRDFQQNIRDVLTQNKLVSVQTAVSTSPAVAEPALAFSDDTEESVLMEDSFSSGVLEQEVPNRTFVAESNFDRLQKNEALKPEQKVAETLGRIDELRFKQSMADSVALPEPEEVIASKKVAKRKRKEQIVLPEALAVRDAAADGSSGAIRITAFESEVDPFSFSLLDSGHFVLYRKVWREGQRYTQGALFDQKAFLEGLVAQAFNSSVLAAMSNVVVAYQGEVLALFQGRAHQRYISSPAELQGELLYKTRISSPLANIQLVFSINQLPVGAGATVVVWTAAALVLVLLTGFVFLYRLGIKQIELVRQQRDFVSAVSHELKTPLTSIRMYGEMLREGWVKEDKKAEYYNYIHAEGERLSRLINNVLQLARMERNDFCLNIQTVPVSQLLDQVNSAVSSQLEHGGFEFSVVVNLDKEKISADVDIDAFVQIMINLVDNAVKFSQKAERKRIEIECKLSSSGTIVFTVRDYGPGIAKDQVKKIFRLFYRSENELTRETVGTGIGLALVSQLVRQMDAKIDVINCDPGAMFTLSFNKKI